ncbi:MAG: prepilin peptidase [Nanoarchaeota archaeon]
MSVEIILLSVGIAGMIVGSVSDIKKREVADWVNYFLIFAGLGIRLITSISTGEWSFFLYGLLGFASFLAIAYLMFFTGQWGGGDSKMLVGMGALFATYPEILRTYFDPELLGYPFLLSFWINLLLVGAVYGILWTLGLGIVHFSDMRKALGSRLGKKRVKKIRLVSHIAAAALIIVGLIIPALLVKVTSIVFGAMILFFFYLYILIKAVEEACMYKTIPPTELVEGDWPLEDIVVDGKTIFSAEKKIGLEEDDIEKIMHYYEKGKIEKLDVKNGVPFVPSFLFALIVTAIYGNLVTVLLI